MENSESVNQENENENVNEEEEEEEGVVDPVQTTEENKNNEDNNNEINNEENNEENRKEENSEENRKEETFLQSTTTVENNIAGTDEEKVKNNSDDDRVANENLLALNVPPEEKKLSYAEMMTYRCFQNTIQQISFIIPQEGIIGQDSASDLINSHCCYIFYFPSLEQLFVWIGKSSSIEDSQLIEKILPDLVIDLHCTQNPIIFRRLDDAPPPEFPQALASLKIDLKAPTKNEAIHVYQYDQTTNTNSSSSSPSSPSHLRLLAKYHPDSASYSTKLPMSILDDQHIIVLESAINIYIWVGLNCSCPKETSDLISSHFFHSKKIFHTIHQGNEPLLFRLLFHDWNPHKIIGFFSTSPTAQSSTTCFGSSPSPTRRKSLVAERRQSFTKHNSIPDMSSLLPQRQGSFYTKVQGVTEGHIKWSLSNRSTSSEGAMAMSPTTTSIKRTSNDEDEREQELNKTDNSVTSTASQTMDEISPIIDPDNSKQIEENTNLINAPITETEQMNQIVDATVGVVGVEEEPGSLNTNSNPSEESQIENKEMNSLEYDSKEVAVLEHAAEAEEQQAEQEQEEAATGNTKESIEPNNANKEEKEEEATVPEAHLSIDENDSSPKRENNDDIEKITAKPQNIIIEQEIIQSNVTEIVHQISSPISEKDTQSQSYSQPNSSGIQTREESVSPSLSPSSSSPQSPSQRPQSPSTIPIYQKNQCYCM